ncbi:MAG: hypothetical protein U0802_25205 [Candidatus Binatia bacterium]
MPLSDDQIERYSRQIVLAEIGGRGQERLLTSVAAVLGSGDTAATAVRYLAGAGVGTLWLADAGERALAALRALNPDVTVAIGDAGAAATVVLAADLELDALDEAVRRARAQRQPLIAASSRGPEGWIAVDGCASCAARAAPWTPADPDLAPLAPVASTMLGSLLAMAALEWILGRRPAITAPRWFDATSSALSALAPVAAADCRGCSRAA